MALLEKVASVENDHLREGRTTVFAYNDLFESQVFTRRPVPDTRRVLCTVVL